MTVAILDIRPVLESGARLCAGSVMPVHRRRSYRDGWSSGRLWPTVRLVSLFLMSGVVHGAPDGSPASTTLPEEHGDRFSIHWQATYVEQETLGFNAPYRGPNSLSPNMGRETVDTTLFAGARLWSGAAGSH